MGIKLKLCNPKACKLEHSRSLCLPVSYWPWAGRDGRVLNQLRLRGKTESTAKLCPRESNHQSRITSPEDTMTLCLFGPLSLPRSYGSGLRVEVKLSMEGAGVWTLPQRIGSGGCYSHWTPWVGRTELSLREDRNKNNTICTSLWSFNYCNE